MFEYLSPRNGPVVDGLQHLETKYAEHQPEYIPLRTLKSKSEMGQVISRWTLTAEQRKMIADGADIFLELSTFHQPLQPIRIAISDCSGEMFVDWFKVSLLDLPATAVNQHDEKFAKEAGISLDGLTTTNPEQMSKPVWDGKPTSDAEKAKVSG